MKNFIIITVFVGVSFIGAGCGDPVCGDPGCGKKTAEEEPVVSIEPEKKETQDSLPEIDLVVERIFMGTPNKYTVMYKWGESVFVDDLRTIVEKRFGYGNIVNFESIVFKEIPEDEPLRIFMKTSQRNPDTFWGHWPWSLEIYIHKPGNVEGGKWQYSYKEGRHHRTVKGETQAVE